MRGDAAGWDSRSWIINLGANDSGYCSTDVNCARAAIMLVVDEIGPGHQIWWPKVTRLYTHQYQANVWNVALDQIAAERSDFTTWDWPAAMWGDPTTFASYDGTHLYPDGYRSRSALMADVFTATWAKATRGGGDAALPAGGGVRSELVGLAPTRIVDTRSDAPGRLAARATLTVDFGRSIPDDATAVAVNLTAVNPSAAGFLTAYPCDRPVPNASSVNHAARATRAAAAVVPLSSDDTICIVTDAASDVIVDLQGAFVPEGTHEAASRMTPLDVPRRLLDTRASGRSSVVEIATPPGAVAVAVNLTASNGGADGYLTAYPCEQDIPEISNVNFRSVESIAGAAFVATSDRNTICVSSSTAVDVIIDLTATFDVDTGFVFVPVQPSRMLDTRSGIGGWAPVQGAGQTLDIRVAPPSAKGVTGTVTFVEPVRAGFITAFPCGVSRPETSSVNASAGATIANSVTVGVGTDARLCLHADAVTQTLFDLTGWWVD